MSLCCLVGNKNRIFSFFSMAGSEEVNLIESKERHFSDFVVNS